MFIELIAQIPVWIKPNAFKTQGQLRCSGSIGRKFIIAPCISTFNVRVHIETIKRRQKIKTYSGHIGGKHVLPSFLILKERMGWVVSQKMVLRPMSPTPSCQYLKKALSSQAPQEYSVPPFRFTFPNYRQRTLPSKTCCRFQLSFRLKSWAAGEQKF